MAGSGLLRRPALALACVALGFLMASVVASRPADPGARLPRQARLAALIERQQRGAEVLRRQAVSLRGQVERVRTQRAGGEAQSAAAEAGLDDLALVAGLVPVSGPGVRVTLDDSELDRAPTDNVNDLVIHSQDVQAVVNALWKAGAEAVAINGQRLVGTSAVLCVGNTLLLNGTVHSPPYVVSAVGASREVFEADGLVRRLHGAAADFGLRFSVSRLDELDVPAYRGSTTLTHARPAAG